MEIQSLFNYLQIALDEDKIVMLSRSWSRGDAIGCNLKIVITVDNTRIVDNGYSNKEWNIYQISAEFDELKHAIHKTLYNQALEILAKELGFKDIDDMYSKTIISNDDDGNPIVIMKNGKMYTAVFCHCDLYLLAVEDVETCVFQKPKVREVMDC